MMNKKRLAALAMSAVMAAGTVSIPVNAADFSDGAAVQEATAEAETLTVDVVEDETPAVGAELVSISEEEGSWDVSKPSVAIIKKYSDGTSDRIVLTNENATFTKEEGAATCTEAGWYRWSVKYEGKTFVSEKKETGAPLGHDFKEELRVVRPATCTEAGSAEVWEVCQRSTCKEEHKKADAEPITLPKTGHKFGTDAVVTYEKGENTVINSDGKPELVIATEDGTYFEVTTGTCTVCHEKATNRVEKNLEASVTIENGLKIIEVSENIADEDIKVGNTFKTVSELPKSEDIALNNCTKDAYYIYEVYGTDGEVADTVKVDVKAHHMLEALSADSVKSEDKNLLTVKKNADGELVVMNTTCLKDVKYTIERKCTRCDYVSKEEKVAPKSDNHVVDSTLKKDIQDLVDAGKPTDYDALIAKVGANNKYAKVVNVTATCDSNGTADVEFLCKLCGEKAATVSGVKVSMDHKYVTKSENKVEATCQAAGSYDSVTACERCGKEKSRKTITIQRLTHTNEKSTELNGTGKDIEDSIFANDNKTVSDATIKFVGSLVFGQHSGKDEAGNITIGENYTDEDGNVITSGTVSAVVITDCAVCHTHQVKLDPSDKLTIKVKAVTEETKDIVTGKATAPGSITLVATYTEGNQTLTKEITLPYYSKAMDTTVGYTGLHKDVDGVYRYYVNGEFDEDFAGIVEFNGGDYFVANGVLCQDAMGINQNVDGKWYFLAYGRVQDQHTGFAEYDGAWFYIVDGVLDENVNGLLDYDGGTFLFAKGRLVKEHNGLWQNADGKWYYLAQGQVQNQYTGLAQYDGAWFYVEKGVLAEDFSGTVEYDGAKFTVKNGMVVQ